MDITWLGHACFRLRADDIIVVTDPFPASIGLRPDARPATMVTVSNTHVNHSGLEEVVGGPRVFSAPGEYEFRSVSVRGVMTPQPPETPLEQRNVAFTIEMDGINICHLGDITAPLTTAQIDDLAPVDVLMIPTGGGCTMDVDQVLQTMQDLAPKVVIPMHHSHPEIKNVPLQGVEVFMNRMGLSEAQAQPRVSVTTSNLTPDMRVVLLAPQGRPA